jgi:thiamine-phosphate pyrophosphorylase
MKIVVFSSSNKVNSEIPEVIKMFENGLACFHLRKPKLRLKELDKYILAIPEKYRNRIVLHTHHELASLHGLKGVHHSRAHRKMGSIYTIKIGIAKMLKKKMFYSRSYHSLAEVKKSQTIYDYVFLSPVFDSISKNYHKSSFAKGELEQILKSTKQNIYALGGITPENVEMAFKMGFDGVAVLGYIWKVHHNPLDAFLTIKEKINQLDDQLSIAV